MLRTSITLLCVCFVLPAHAKIGEGVPQVIKRFGKPYAIETLEIGQTYKFRSDNVSVDATFVDGVSVAETYFSDHPLNPQGEPPNDIVQTVLRTNAPGTQWIEVMAAPLGADYALRSSDGKYIATLKYSGPQPENAIWTMTVAVASLLDQLRPAATPAPSPPAASVTPPQSSADLLSERGDKYSLLGDYENAIADYEVALKIRPNDHKTEVRLESARAMLALRTAPPPRLTITPHGSASVLAPLEPAPKPAPMRAQGPGLFSQAVRIVGFIGTIILYGIALATALKRKTRRWIGAAVLATILFGMVCLLFIRALPVQITRPRRDVAFNPGQIDVAVPSPSVSGTPVPIPIVAERIQRAVVLIAGMSSSGKFVGSGTGFFVSADGRLLTCWHVVAPEDIDHLRITRSDGSECNLEGVLGFSAQDDVILLKTSVTGADFLTLRAPRADKPAVGTRTLVFGNPGQLRGVWSEGDVSGFVFNVKGAKQDRLRFDAPIAPGSSGSPLVDIKKGDVVGIVAAAGWLGNFAVPFYYVDDLVDSLQRSTPVSLPDFRANLEKEKPAMKQRVYDNERASDFAEAGRLCDEYSARYPGDTWGPWEHAQISFAGDDYLAASFYTAWLQPAKDPGDDMLCAIQFESGNALFWSPVQRESLKRLTELLRKDYGVDICTVQMRSDKQLNVREKPDTKSNILYQFDADEHVFAKQDRVRNSAGKEIVIWRKVLLLPSRDRIHGGEGWLNERYLAPSDPY